MVNKTSRTYEDTKYLTQRQNGKSAQITLVPPLKTIKDMCVPHYNPSWNQWRITWNGRDRKIISTNKPGLRLQEILRSCRFRIQKLCMYMDAHGPTDQETKVKLDWGDVIFPNMYSEYLILSPQND